MFKTLKPNNKSVLKRRKKDLITKNQRSIIGVLIGLMEGQKVIASVLRIIDSENQEKTVTIGFKVGENSIPKEIDSDRIKQNNLINIEIDGCKPMHSMIVSIGSKF